MTNVSKITKKLIKLRDEAALHRDKYETYKDSSDEWLRRKVAVDLDRFLMEHREVAIILIAEALEREVKSAPSHNAAATRTSWWRRITTKTVRP